MSRALIVRQAGPGVTIQDRGRPGYLDRGLSRGGAMDRHALAEGAALLGQDGDLAALELAGQGGQFEPTEDMRIALTGAPMRATLEGARLAWNASHRLPAGSKLVIGGVMAGTYGYLHVGGGIAVDPVLGSRSVHRTAGLGAATEAGDVLPVGADPGGATGFCLTPADRLGGGAVRVVASVQTGLFRREVLDRFEATEFQRDARANRMGARLVSGGEGFSPDGGLSILSEVVVPGDIQITGDGPPFVLLAECQTTGGYPRIASVIHADLPIVAQAPAGAALRFRFVSLAEGVAADAAARADMRALPSRLSPLVRDPGDIADLLSYQLVGGVISARDS